MFTMLLDTDGDNFLVKLSSCIPLVSVTVRTKGSPITVTSCSKTGGNNLKVQQFVS